MPKANASEIIRLSAESLHTLEWALEVTKNKLTAAELDRDKARAWAESATKECVRLRDLLSQHGIPSDK